jgi:prolyl oligopeptidase
MSRSLSAILAAVLALAGPRSTQASPWLRAPKAPVPIDEYFKIRRLPAAFVTSDEKRVVFASDAGGRIDLWVKSLRGGDARQITRVNGKIHGFEPSPTEDRLAFEADQGGDELPHLYLTNLAGESPKDLAADYPAGRRTQLIGWSDDGKKLSFLSTARDEENMDLVEYDIASRKSETLWKASGKLSFGTSSRDGRRWVVTETVSDADSNLYLVERGNPETAALLTKHTGDVQYQAHEFSLDGKTLYYTTDEGREFTALAAMGVGSVGVGSGLRFVL